MKRFIKMTTLLAAVMGTVSLTGCGDNNTAKDIPPAQEETESASNANENIESKSSTVKPMPPNFNIKDGIKDGTYAVSFKADDFDGKELTACIYNMDIYNADEINNLEQGDTIVVGENEIEIEKIDISDKYAEINGGLGESETGTTFISNENGAYRILGYDDYSTYTELGSVSLPVSEKCIFTDERHQFDENGEIKTIAFAELESYIKNEKENNHDDFDYTNTTITVEGGEITAIKCIFTP